MNTARFHIRPFEPRDTRAVRELFIRVNRALAPPGMEEAFEVYVSQSLREEIDCLLTYYADRKGVFLVGEVNSRICGMFGLETAAPGIAELRRMYVDPDRRGEGLGRTLLSHAEAEARRGRFHAVDPEHLRASAGGILAFTGPRDSPKRVRRLPTVPATRRWAVAFAGSTSTRDL